MGLYAFGVLKSHRHYIKIRTVTIISVQLLIAIYYILLIILVIYSIILQVLHAKRVITVNDDVNDVNDIISLRSSNYKNDQIRLFALALTEIRFKSESILRVYC